MVEPCTSQTVIGPSSLRLKDSTGSTSQSCLIPFFFSKGKFYELYETDADIASKEFNLKVADRVNMRMAGIPEVSFEHWASKFIALGYKVAKVEQTSSALDAGPSRGSPANKVVLFEAFFRLFHENLIAYCQQAQSVTIPCFPMKGLTT